MPGTGHIQIVSIIIRASFLPSITIHEVTTEHTKLKDPSDCIPLVSGKMNINTDSAIILVIFTYTTSVLANLDSCFRN